MKVLVCGSRNLPNKEELVCKLFIHFVDDRLGIETIISGTAKGGDLLGESWAENNGVIVEHYAPDWNKHGKSAGFIRNKQMVDRTDAVIAFWDGKSKGTKHTIDLAIKQNKPCFIYKF